MNIFRSRIFTINQLFIFSISFAFIFIFTQRVFRRICETKISFDCPYYFPMSIFTPRLPTLQDLSAAIILGLIFIFFLKILESQKYSLPLVILAAILLTAGSNLIQGIGNGYYTPIAGDGRGETIVPFSYEGQEYYHEALKIEDPLAFFANYNQIQPTLSMHAHTHPPGAVLTLYFFKMTLNEPPLIAFAIMAIAMLVTVYFFKRLLQTEVDEETARYTAFLLALLPAIQIYYLATLDALITALLTATLFLFCFGKNRKTVFGAALTLSFCFLLTFVSLFILPVLVGFEIIVRRQIKRSIITLGGVAGFHLLLYLLTGYNAWQSFRTASLYENPEGFMLFVNPVNYFFTRIEDIGEIIFFFGPFLLVLLIRGIRKITFSPLNILFLLGAATLILMYVTGAWRTGETARACAFIYPYLLFPIAIYLRDIKIDLRERWQLVCLVFGQTVVMQTFGNYFW